MSANELYDAVIFDLDGTLADTLGDIGAAMDRTLDQLEMPRRTLADYRRFVGDGARELVRLSLSDDSVSRTDEVLAVFRVEYRKKLIDETRVFAGVPELLRELAHRNVPMAVLSNKPHVLTLPMVAELFGDVSFATVLGQRDGIPHKPDPIGAFEAADALSVAASRCAFVGDTHVDMETAVNAGMLAVGVEWGFRDADELRAAGAAHVLSTPGELLGLRG